MRELKRQIAKARLAAMGVGNVNKRTSIQRSGVPLWRRVITGDLADRGSAAQRSAKIVKSRKLRRVEK